MEDVPLREALRVLVEAGPTIPSLFMHSDLPAGISRSICGTMRGMLSVNIVRNWHDVPAIVKLAPRSTSLQSMPKSYPNVSAPVATRFPPIRLTAIRFFRSARDPRLLSANVRGDSLQ